MSTYNCDFQEPLDGCKHPFPAGGDVSTNLIREFSESSALAGGNADYVEALYNAWRSLALKRHSSNADRDKPRYRSAMNMHASRLVCCACLRLIAHVDILPPTSIHSVWPEKCQRRIWACHSMA